MKKKYFTEEERKAAKREANKQYYQNNKEKILEQRAEYRQTNKEKIAEYNAEYRQNNKDKIAERNAEYRQNNKEHIAEYNAEYRQNNKEKIAEYNAEYYSTPFGRAGSLLKSYKRNDKKYNRGECTIDAQWIVDNIFSGQCCHYCGESDWRELGCDRIDNSLPHVPDNVVPCCDKCNKKKGTTPYEEFMRLIKKVG